MELKVYVGNGYYYCYVRCMTKIVWEMPRPKTDEYTVWTTRQKSCNQRFSCMSSVAYPTDSWTNIYRIDAHIYREEIRPLS